jgi:acetyltransferase-like isoleucine patch superfamily enzyme
MNSDQDHGWLDRLRALCIRIYSGTKVQISGSNHRVEWSNSRVMAGRIEISGTNNELIIGSNTRLWETTIKINGNNLRCFIGSHCRLRCLELIVEDNGSSLVIGSDSSGTGARLLAGEGGRVEIGDDCMMSVGADVRNTDGHSILDLETRERANPAADVRIGKHCWIGLRAQILKGVTIGEQSIVGAGSVVVHDVPPCVIVVGTPARVVRSGITWVRERLRPGAHRGVPAAVQVEVSPS